MAQKLSETKIKIVKNKLAPPFKTVEVDILYGQGINKESCLIDMAIEADIIQKSGSWFSYNGEKIGQGKDNVRLFLKNNPDIYDKLEELIREKLDAGKKTNQD